MNQKPEKRQREGGEIPLVSKTKIKTIESPELMEQSIKALIHQCIASDMPAAKLNFRMFGKNEKKAALCAAEAYANRADIKKNDDEQALTAVEKVGLDLKAELEGDLKDLAAQVKTKVLGILDTRINAKDYFNVAKVASKLGAEGAEKIYQCVETLLKEDKPKVADAEKISTTYSSKKGWEAIAVYYIGLPEPVKAIKSLEKAGKKVDECPDIKKKVDEILDMYIKDERYEEGEDLTQLVGDNLRLAKIGYARIERSKPEDVTKGLEDLKSAGHDVSTDTEAGIEVMKIADAKRAKKDDKSVTEALDIYRHIGATEAMSAVALNYLNGEVEGIGNNEAKQKAYDLAVEIGAKDIADLAKMFLGDAGEDTTKNKD